MDTQKHISSAFDQDLTLLNDALQKLGDLACRQFECAIEGIATQNEANLDSVIKGDAALDALEAEINEKVMEIITKRLIRYELRKLKSVEKQPILN